MDDTKKSKAELIEELRFLRRRLAEKEQAITMAEQAETALKDSEKKFRSLAESTNAHISIIQDDRYIYANQAFLDYHGLERDDLEFLMPEDLAMGMLSQEAIAKAGIAWQKFIESGKDAFHFEISDMDGHWFQTNVTTTELDGKPSFIALSFDVTNLKETEAKLKESERRYRTIFETTGTAMVSYGRDAVITLANEEWAKLSGYAIEETVGKMTWMPFFSQPSLKRMHAYHETREKTQSAIPKAYEADFIDRYGKIHNGIVTVQLVPGTEQRVASFQDLTELRRAESEMYRADKMAALGQIIAGVAHEINNPNNFIFFNLPILRRYIEAIRPMLEHHLDEDPDLKILNMPYEAFLEDIFKLLENMEHGSKRITGIVSELKAYVRSDEETTAKIGPIEPVIERVMALVGKQVRKMVKHFDVTIEDGLPKIQMNPGKIEQVIINMVINAGQAANKSDSWVKLKAKSKEYHHQQWLHICVEDNGSGIPETIRDQIFEPFFTSKGRETGTGLGLSICHRIVEEHGGRIRVETTPDVGTMFCIELPGAER